MIQDDDEDELKNCCLSLLFNKVLLRPNDRPWSTDPNPSDGLCSGQAVMFHHVTANQGASPPQTSCQKHTWNLKQ